MTRKFISALLFLHASISALNILHLSFHRGCIEEINQVAKECGVNITPWYIFNSKESFNRFFPDASISFDIYNMTHSKAEKIWNTNKAYFEKFDAIMTSDTAPLSRIFLQNNWKKPLIIWICNRFDLRFDYPGCGFPDQEYYDLIHRATQQKNVQIISYTPYEYEYAASKNVSIGTHVIKPIGKPCEQKKIKTFFPDISKQETLYLSPLGGNIASHAWPEKSQYIIEKLEEAGIKACWGKYNGPDDLIDFKAVLHFPYQASVFSLFEEIQRGIIHCVPSKKFLSMAAQSNNTFMPCKSIGHSLTSFDDSEWYKQENEELFVYFDSWADLKEKIETIDYESMRKKILIFAANHKATMLARWNAIFKKVEHFFKKELSLKRSEL